MTKREAIDVLQKHKMCDTNCPSECSVCPHFVSVNDVIEANEIALENLIRADEQERADGCAGCAFESYEEWDEPCAHCRRNTRDMWRKKPE